MTTHCCQDGKPVSHVHQLLNHVIDCKAARFPQALYAEYPVSATSYEHGFVKISYKKLANAINRFAWFLVDNIGRGHDFETVAYIGPNDIVYPSVIFGAVKAGYKALLLSPRNSIEAQLHLLETTKCRKFLVPEPCPPPVAALLKSLGDSYQIITVPSVQKLLEPRCKHFVYDVSYEQGKSTPLMVLHSSGSTGLPQARVLSQYFLASYAQHLQLTPPSGFESLDKLYQGNRVFVLAPPFHGAHFAQSMNAITSGSALIHPLTGAIPSAESLIEAIKYTSIDAAMVVPVMLEEISRSPKLLDEVSSRLDVLCFAGGAVPQTCGDIISSRIRLVSLWGSTETGAVSLLCPEEDQQPGDWRYLSFHPDAGVEFRPYADDKHELTFVRRHELEGLQPVFIAFPDLQEWRTRDLFRKHPTKPSMWTHCGRADDTIVLLTGEKIAPTDMEQYILSQHQEINGAMITGAQRFQPALLIELVNDDQRYSKIDLVKRFWPSIEKANESLPGHAQITKSHILVLDPGQSFSRTDKGSVRRSATVAQYESELTVLYNDADHNQLDEAEVSSKTCDLQNTDGALRCVRSIVCELTGQALDDDDNFFVQGMDSLQALRLFRAMKSRISSIPQFDIRIVYAYPTTRSLVAVLQKIVKDGSGPDSLSTSLSVSDITSMITKYSNQIDQIPRVHKNLLRRQEPPVYIVTGSTGSLGSHILESLLKVEVGHIYCLNRSSDGKAAQLRRNTQRGLSTDLPSNKVTFLTVDLSLPSLGLDAATLNKLSNSVTHIVHNAWTVNFNIPLSYYKSQIEGVVNVVQFCNTAAQRPLLLYISSIGAVARPSDRNIPERIVDEPEAATLMGYGASKYISEHLLGHAVHQLGLDIRIARVGQIAGPLEGLGEWNRSEWLPSIIRSAAEIRALPAFLGAELEQVDWIPADVLGQVLLEVSTNDSAQSQSRNGASLSDHTGEASGDVEVFNIVNPQTLQWRELVPAIAETLSSLCEPHNSSDSKQIQIVSFEEWARKIRMRLEAQEKAQGNANGQAESMDASLESNPAAKLLGFYEDAYKISPRVWNTDKAQRVSPALRSVGTIKHEWLDKWMRAWF